MKISKGLTLVIALIGTSTFSASAQDWGQPLSWERAVEEKLPETDQLISLGRKIFNKACFFCHGDKGEGDGKGRRYLAAMPRDFTSGAFKLRTTSSESLPVDEDLFRTITMGIPEYRMPRFNYLSPKERWALVYYVKTFYPDYKEDAEYTEPVVVGEPPRLTRAVLAKGKKVFSSAECWKCHGENGHGDGPSASTLRDDWDNPVILLDWAQGKSAFKRGATVRDVMYTFMTGMSGSPMPSYRDSLTDDEAWALAYYVREMVERGKK